MLTGTYPKDQEVRFSAEFKNAAKQLADPSTVTAKIMDPAGEVTTYVYGTDAEVVRDSLGRYHLDIVLTSSGKWTYQWKGSGTITTADEAIVTAEPSAFP